MASLVESSFIYGAARTPIGKFNGALASVPAPDLAALAIREAVQRSGVSGEEIDELILGNVLSAGLGQAPARQAALKAALPCQVGATLVNKVCGSGLKAIMLADQAIRLRQARFVVAGGMENMSRAPFLQMDARRGYRLGNQQLIDSLVHDGLWDSFGDCHMGAIAEALARRENISREMQDDYAALSYQRARLTQDRCDFSREIVGVPVADKNRARLVTKDEQPYADDLDKLTQLPPIFVKDGGTITAGNASSLNDGAAALVLGPYESRRHPLARIVTSAAHARAPEEFPLAPVEAIRSVLRQWGIALEDVDLFEINEAFAVASLAVARELNLDLEKVNVFGGAVALGHPIGASGARILVTLLNAMKIKNRSRGIAAICLGGGEALALGVEMMREG